MELADFPKDVLDTVCCGLCNGLKSNKRFVIHGFPVLRCKSCNLSYVSPRLNQHKLNELYSDENYFKSDNSLVSGYVDYVADKEHILRTFEKRFVWLLQKTKKKSLGRVLDVGCATGFSLEYMLSQGWDPVGVELSSFAAHEAKKKFGDRVHHGTLESASFQKNSFDTILIWDVIEHVPDPLQTLRDLYDLLMPGGVLSIITPDCESLVARLMGRFWMEYSKPTEHIYFFSRKTLRTALQKTGFNYFTGGTAGKYVGLNFLVDRFCAYFPLARGLKRQSFMQKSARYSVYINPGDKMMLLAVKT